MTGNAITITKVFKGVTPVRLYTAWTDPGLIAQWFGPEGFVNTVHAMDVRVGGSYRLTMLSPDGSSHPLRGTFLELVPREKICLTWQWENPETPESVGHQETRVTVTFKDIGGDTEMTMIHDQFNNEEQAANHNSGWTSSFNKLETVVSR